MKFPVFSLLAGNLGSRDGFARDCLLQRRVLCEPLSNARQTGLDKQQAVQEKPALLACYRATSSPAVQVPNQPEGKARFTSTPS